MQQLAIIKQIFPIVDRQVHEPAGTACRIHQPGLLAHGWHQHVFRQDDGQLCQGGAGTEARSGHDGERASGGGCQKMADATGRRPL